MQDGGLLLTYYYYYYFYTYHYYACTSNRVFLWKIIAVHIINKSIHQIKHGNWERNSAK